MPRASVFLSLFALVLAMGASPVQAGPAAQPAQPFSLHAVQSSTGALFLTLGSTIWPMAPDLIADDELASIAIGDPTNTVDVDPRLAPPPRTRVVEAGDGSLYVTFQGSRWNTGFPLVPDQISDADLAALNLGNEIDGTIPLDLAAGTTPGAPAISATQPAQAADTSDNLYASTAGSGRLFTWVEGRVQPKGANSNSIPTPSVFWFVRAYPRGGNYCGYISEPDPRIGLDGPFPDVNECVFTAALDAEYYITAQAAPGARYTLTVKQL